MQDQNIITLETLLGQLASNQNAKAIREFLAHPELLTMANLEQVLKSLLDPVSFYYQYVSNLDDFEEGLRKEYHHLLEDIEAWKAYCSQHKDTYTLRPEELQGAIGLVCFTIGVLKEAGHQGKANRDPINKHLQELLDDPAVRNCFYQVYAPTPFQASGQGSSNEETEATENLKKSRQFWQALRQEKKRLELYRVGTTSFILRCQVESLVGMKGKLLVLKCLLFPYTQMVQIARATRDYAITYPPDDMSMTAKVHSSTDKWILMDFIEGLTLRELLDKRREEEKAEPSLLRTDLLVSIGQPLLQALSCLPPNIRHEDLTPSNIIVSKNEDGSPKIVLVDLGRNYLHMHKIGLVENQETLFVAPEVRDDSSTDTSDLYSFGMILIELADPTGVRNTIIPDSLYMYVPILARFVEDLIDVDPTKRLLIFGSQGKEDTYHNLLRAFSGVLQVLPPDSEVKADSLHLDLWVRQFEIRISGFSLVRQIRDLFFPTDQVKYYLHLWQLAKSSEHPEIARYAGRLYGWVLLCSIHWWLVFLFCFSWGFLRDFGIANFSLPMTVAQRYMFHCENCVPVFDWFGHPGNFLPARLTICNVIAQTKYYQNIFAGLTAAPMKDRLARFTEITIRGSAICSLLFMFLCNVIEPTWWLIMLVPGLFIGINNVLCYQLATRTLDSARKAKMSTVSLYEDIGLKAFGTWGPNTIAYIVLLIAIWIGLGKHWLHDVWLYVILTVGISIFIWTVSKCINSAPGVRGGLMRAFIAGERLKAMVKH